MMTKNDKERFNKRISGEVQAGLNESGDQKR